MSAIIINNIPDGLQTDFLRETESAELPVIRREGSNLIFPALVREETRQMAEGEITIFRFFEVPVPFTGQNASDYEKCMYQSYAALRKHFYGDWAVQNEQILKGTFAKHQYAVKTAFPKRAGEVLPEVTRFEAIKADFWNKIDVACASVGKTREDLPAKFNAEEMLAWAVENGMGAADIATYAQAFSVVSLDLLQNGRNWDELF